MPTIRRVANCKIAIYADDHMRHIEYRGFRAIMEVETMLRAGSVRKAHDAMAWGARQCRFSPRRMASSQRQKREQ